MKWLGSFVVVFALLCVSSSLSQSAEDELLDAYNQLKDVLDKLKLSDTKNVQLANKVEELEKKVRELEKKLKDSQSSTSSAPLKSPCPTNIGANSTCFSTNNPRGCYCLISMSSSWTQARTRCLERGTQLVSIETAAENEAIKRLFATKSNFEKNGGAGLRLWTSGSDKDKQDNWVWTSTGQPIGFTDWRPDEPSKEFVGEDYLDFWFGSDSQGWNDAPDNPGEFGWEVFPLCERL